ncbi:MAG: hypothetical protein HY850_01145 [Betaproteobacteria bacterium]|nr:hypothetical protein [Betaproteobacteria bacterium]
MLPALDLSNQVDDSLGMVLALTPAFLPTHVVGNFCYHDQSLVGGDIQPLENRPDRHKYIHLKIAQESDMGQVTEIDAAGL